MPGSPVTRTRVITRDTCILGFTGNVYRKSFVFDATTLTADANGFFTVPIGTFVTRSPADPTKIKAYQGLGTNVNAVQTVTITGTPTGGTFALTFNGQTTGAIAYNASAAAVATALNALTNVGAGGVATGGGAFPGAAVTVTFSGAALSNQPQPLLTVSNSALTGGTTPGVTVATTTPGQTAEAICGVYDGPQHDFFGNSVAADEAVPVYDQFTAFDSTKLVNWAAYRVAAIAALPTCTFQP